MFKFASSTPRRRDSSPLVASMKQKSSSSNASATSLVLRCLILSAAQIIIGKLSGVPCDALRMINLDAPQMAIQGDTIQLSCSYSLADSKRQNSALALIDLNEGNGRGGSDQSDDSGHANRASSPPLPTKRKFATRKVHISKDDRLSAHKDVGATYKLLDGASAPGQTELLYAIKWYKDEREFFRFVTQDWPHKQALPMSGLDIDVSCLIRRSRRC